MDQFTNLVKLIAVKAPWIRYACPVIYVPSSLSKFVMVKVYYKKAWPMLPNWFWPSCGLFELIAAAMFFYYKSKIAEALIMSYMFLGGVLSSSTTLGFKPENLPPFFTCVVSTAVIGLDNGIEPSTTHALALAGGFLIGNLIPILFGPKESSKKKS